MKNKKREVRSRIALGLSFLMLLNGVWILIESLIVHLPDRFDRFIIADSEHLNRQLSVLAGLGLIYFSRKLRFGKRNAWYLTILSLAIFLQYALLHPAHHIVGIAGSIISLVGLLLAEHEFRVHSDPASLKQSITNAFIVLVVALLYGSIGFTILDRKDFPKDFSPRDSIVRTVRQYTLMGNNDMAPQSRQARVFMDSLNVMGVGSLVLIGAALLRPVRFAIGQLPYEYREAERLLEKYSQSPEDFLKLWPTHRKHLYFDESRQAFLSFGVFSGVAVVLDDPAGNTHYIPQLIESFVTYARANDWLVGFGHCSNAWEASFTDLGLEMIPIGREAMISVDDFMAETAGDKHFRYNRNKFTKQGLRTEILKAPISDAMLEELREVSDDWLGQGNRKERTFAMGYFDKTYLQNCDVCVVFDANNRVVAFTNLLPVYRKDFASVDLMRYRRDAPPGLMNFVFLALIEHLHANGVSQFNLGFSPLSGIEKEALDDLPTAVLKLIKQFGGSFFSFDGLEQFKGKFRPNWQNRYIAYEGGSGGLLRVTLALLRAMRIDN